MSHAYYRKFALLLLLGVCLFSGTAIAQGVVSGSIIDEENGEPLIGATLLQQDTPNGTVTDFDGKYSLQLPAGTYDFKVSYIGYPDKVVEGVEVVNDEITYLDITMSDAQGVALMLNVTVKAERLTNTEAAVLVERKEAIAISDNISVQEMARYGASDATGALRKVTGASVEGGKYIFVRGLGDRYSLSQLNGLVIPSTDPYRNSAQLDLIPTSIVDNISTTKTFTPDQPGSFTGGNVDIRTKKFPDLPTFTISLTTAYNSQSNLISDFLTHEGGDNDYFGYDNARGLPRSLSDPATRALLSRSSEGQARRNGNEEAANALDAGARSVIAQVTPTPTRTPLDHGISVAYGNKFNFGDNTLGLIATATFKQDYNNLKDFREGNWSILSFDDDELFNNGDFNVNRSILNPTTSGLVGLAYRVGANHEFSFTSMYNHSTEKTSRTVVGERPQNLFFPRLLQGYQLSFVEQELLNFQIGGEHNFPSLKNAKIEWKTSLVNSSQIEPQTRFFENTWNVEQERFGFGGADTNDPFYFWRDLQDEQVSGKLDFTIPFSKLGNSIKVGGLYSVKDRTNTEDRFRLQSTSRAITLDELNGDQNAFIADDNIGILSREEDGDFNIGNYLIDETLPQNSYTGTENIGGIYGMLTYQISERLKTVAGARVELTDIEVISADSTQPIGAVNETDVLPSFSLIYEATEKINIRGTYAKTLARPNMREISSFTIIDPLTSTFERGNPDSLGRSLIDNFDLRFEYFMGGSELVALSGYYKRFTDPIVRQQLASTNNEFQFINTESGYLLGIEFELRKKLGFIVPQLQNFTFVTNASYIFSETKSGAIAEFDPDTRPFISQPEYIVNASLNYLLPETGWDVALAINAVGDRLNAIGSGSRLDQYFQARTQLDFVASKRLGNATVRFGVLNILDSPFTISTEYKGQDFIYSDFRRGVDFKLGVSYRIL